MEFPFSNVALDFMMSSASGESEIVTGLFSKASVCSNSQVTRLYRPPAGFVRVYARQASDMGEILAVTDMLFLKVCCHPRKESRRLTLALAFLARFETLVFALWAKTLRTYHQA